MPFFEWKQSFLLILVPNIFFLILNNINFSFQEKALFAYYKNIIPFKGKAMEGELFDKWVT
jgi:hypothetical protein